MDQIETFGDQQFDKMCSYCGEPSASRDHVPSRVLLDEPFPENLPVVPSCITCNQKFSLDEEYLACAIECAVHGTTEIEKLGRNKVKSILSKKETLKCMIENSFVFLDTQVSFQPEENRIKNVIIKLARGHVKYENSQRLLDRPANVWVKPIALLTDDELKIFNEPPTFESFAEVGSRAMQKQAAMNYRASWTVVQKDVYQYWVSDELGAIIVKILIRNYLAALVHWD